MGQKIRPTILRLGITKDWKSRWFARGFKFAKKLEEDLIIRNIIKENVAKAGIDEILIEKSGNDYKITVKVAKPGLVIGRGGKGVEEITTKVSNKLNKFRKNNGIIDNVVISLNIEEIKRYEVSSQVSAQQIAWDLEKRMPYRRSIKKMVQRIMQVRGVLGVKIRVAGRLNGAEIARAEQISEGSIPLHTIRADIDYGQVEANTTYGTIGVKVWVYKGEKFAKDSIVNKTQGLKPGSLSKNRNL